MRKKYLVILLATVVVAAGIIFIRQRPSAPVPSEKNNISIGLPISPSVGLVTIAKEKGYFDKNGLNIDLKKFTGGKFALQALLGGSVDFAVPAELPATLAAANGNKIVIVTQVADTIGDTTIIAKKEGSLANPKEYFLAKKRKIATSLGSSSEFYTDMFLQKYEIPLAQVEIVGMKPEDMPAALVGGSVDAITVYQPFTALAEEQAGQENVTVWRDQDLYSSKFVAVARPIFIEQNPLAVKKFLQSLKEAGDYIKANPSEAKTIVSSWSGLEGGIIEKIWPAVNPGISLKSTLVVTMRQQAEWAKQKGIIKPEVGIPDFRLIINDSFLRTLDPGAVTL